MYFKIAVRNIINNTRRSLITIYAIAMGYMALSLFAGYIESTKEGLTGQAIVGERLGHLTLVKKGYYEEGKLNPQQYAFDAEQLQQLREITEKNTHIELFSPRLDISGLVSNGDVSTIYFAEAIDPNDLLTLNGEFDMPGKLDPTVAGSGAFGEQLAFLLGLEKGNTAVLVSTTIDGLMNAVDVEVGDVYNTGSTGTNDKFILLSYDFAKSLYGLDGAHRVVLKLDDIDAMDDVIAALNAEFTAKGLSVEIKTWDELSMFYNQVKNLLESMFGFLFMLILVVVGMSILNTMSMAVMERTKEIGTLRSIGVQRVGIVKLFRVEGFLLAAAGCIGGLVLTFLNTFIAEVTDASYVPPGSSEAVPLSFLHLPENLILYFCILVGIAMMAAVFPAKRAAKMPLVDALGYA